jgi:predicted NBD/HSP70 family sugar kinase
MTRTDLTARSQLSKSTVNDAIARLQEAGIVETYDPADLRGRGTGRGRTPALIRIVTEASIIGFVGLSRSRLEATLVRTDGTVLARSESPADPLAHDFDLVESGSTLLTELLGHHPGVALAGIVVGVPGPFQRGVGIAGAREMAPDPAILPHGLPGWMLSDPAAAFSERFGVPALGENDANLAALGEHAFGASRGAGSVVHLELAHGIGAGIVINGALVRGSAGMTGEIGHLQVDADGPVCLCGRVGCLVAVVREDLLRPQAVQEAELRLGDLVTLTRRKPPAELVMAAGVLGRLVSDVCTWLNPEVVVIDGALGEAAFTVRAIVQDALNMTVGQPLAEATRVVIGALGEDAKALGAAALARSDLHVVL